MSVERQCRPAEFAGLRPGRQRGGIRQGAYVRGGGSLGLQCQTKPF